MKKIVLVLCFAFSMNAFAAGTRNKAHTNNKSAPVSAVQKSESEEALLNKKSPLDGKLHLEPNFGFAFINPKDINTMIRDQNDAIQKQGIKSFNVSDLGTTSTFGIAALYSVTPNASLGLGFNRMSTSAEGSSSQNGNTLNGTYSIGANMLTAESRLSVLKADNNRLDTYVAPFMGMGWYSGSVEFSGTAMQQSTEVNSSATGFLFGSTAGVRYSFLESLSAGVYTGYRFAKSGVLKVDSQRNSDKGVGSQVDNNGKKISVDASSFMLGANLTWSI